MAIRIEVGYRSGVRDPRGEATQETIASFLGFGAKVRSFDAYTIDAPLDDAEVDRIRQLFTDAVTQHSALDRLQPEPFDFLIAVGFRAGVTDAVGRSALFAVQDALGRKLPEGAAVYTARMYFLSGASREQATRVATGLLANPLIERYEVRSSAEYLASEPDRTAPVIRSAHKPTVQTVDLSGSDEQLVRISRERILSLSLDEMRCIQTQYARASFGEDRAKKGLGSQPTDVELECLAQTWSEHCKHKIFNAQITYKEPGAEPIVVEAPFKQHIRMATEAVREAQIALSGKSWLVSVFHDNAGVIAFNDRWHLVYKVETHNSPSALDPYGGAMTGIVGVNRDPFGTGMGAELLSNVWGYCLADPRHQGAIPQGLMHPRRIRDGVHHGVIDGGNQSGIPYARGWEIFDERYLGKPLVYCGTVGRMPVSVAGRPGHVKEARPGHRIVMCGGRIGKDGIHGATFSSAELDESSPVQAVQIGDPITQKRMFDFLLEALALGLYSAITDNGAGGLSSSVGELCQQSGGAKLELGNAPLKYSGLDPWEVLISEAQERMTLAVPPDKLGGFMALAARREVEASDLGEFTDTGVFEVSWEGKTVAWLPLAFLHDGLPRMQLQAEWTVVDQAPSPRIAIDRFDDVLIKMLRSPNLASGEKKARYYDHEVKGLTVIKPYVGAKADAPSDASVFMVEHGSYEGYVLSEGINPFYSDIDTRWMTASVIDEAVRKAVGTGARLDHLAGLDNYCWPDPIASEKNPDGGHKLAQLVRSTQALSEFCRAYGVPCISGKDSMKNDSTMGGVRISIPPTLLFSVIARIDDVRKAVSLDAKRVGARVYLLGVTRDELGGSELLRALAERKGGKVPGVDPQETLPLYRRVQDAIARELVQSCHSPAKGGLAVALARIAMAAELGLDVDLGKEPHTAGLAAAQALFSESNARFVVTVDPANAAAFEAVMAGSSFACVGAVTEAPRLTIKHAGALRLDAGVMELKAAWKETFDAL
jgi:phosphoribosylformylglycinamidine synthase subunit PurSL